MVGIIIRHLRRPHWESPSICSLPPNKKKGTTPYIYNIYINCLFSRRKKINQSTITQCGSPFSSSLVFSPPRRSQSRLRGRCSNGLPVLRTGSLARSRLPCRGCFGILARRGSLRSRRMWVRLLPRHRLLGLISMLNL